MVDSFNSRLQELRKEKGLTQSQLGKNLNKADSTVRMWELGKNHPDHETLLRLAQIFQVSTDYLLGKNDNRHNDSGQGDNQTLAALNRRPALRALLELTHNASDEELATILRITMAFLQK